MRTSHYSIDEAETRRWEVEYQIQQRCNPILMKCGSYGTLKFKNVLQRQEIERNFNNIPYLMKIIKKRKGKNGNTQWNVDYKVSKQGNVYITNISCHNTFSESLDYHKLKELIENNNQNKTHKTMNRIRLTESQLHNVIKKCVNEAIEEVYDNGNWFETNDGQKGFIVGQGNDSSVDVMIDGDKNVTRNMPWNKLKSFGASKPRYNQYAKFMTSQQGKDYITRDKGWNEDDYNSHINHYNLKQYANESLERIVKQIVLEELNKH